MANKTPHVPNSGLRGIVRAQHARQVEQNRSQGPAIMRAIASKVKGKV